MLAAGSLDMAMEANLNSGDLPVGHNGEFTYLFHTARITKPSHTSSLLSVEVARAVNIAIQG